MAARVASRYLLRRFSSGGRVLSEEEKAAENVYIKKIEQEKLEKLARKGPKPGDQQSPDKPAATDSKPTGSSTGAVSTDKNRNYAVVAGALTLASVLGWYLLSKPKKSEEVSS